MREHVVDVSSLLIVYHEDHRCDRAPTHLVQILIVGGGVRTVSDGAVLGDFMVMGAFLVSVGSAW